MTGSDKSRLHPPSENSWIRAAFRRPSDANPATYLGKIRMALARKREVELARQPDTHRAPGLPRAECGDGGIGIGLHFLAAERTSHAQALDNHLITRHAEHARYDLLRF